jgi:hypothetical protein
VLTAWIAFPLVLTGLGLGWGLLVRRLSGDAVDDALLVPLGLAAAIVLAGLLTASSWLAMVTAIAVTAGAILGLALAWPPRRFSPWPAAAALAVLIAYGAPVLLSGRPTFAGYLRLDDTATWLGIIDRVVSHGRSLSGLSPSTFQLNLNAYVGAGGYPTGSFLLPAVGRALVGGDAAWIFQPYLACCGAALALGINALARPLVESPRLRGGVAFVAAQPALLYGYSLWGGIKELTTAFEVVLLAALVAPLLIGGPPALRRLLPAAVAGAAVMVTLGPGGAVWVAPALTAVAVAWLWRARRSGAAPRALVGASALAGATVVLSLPVLLVLTQFLHTDSALFAGGGGGSSSLALGNLVHPLSVFQLAGVWPVGDFRYAPSRLPAALLIWLVGVTAAGGVWWAVRRRRLELPLYLGVVVVGCVLTAVAGGTPWVVGKALAVASPALLACGLGFVAGRARAARAGLVAAVVITAGVLWSNVLAYHDVLLAPRTRLSELARVDQLVAGAGPTLLNEYEIYGDRHFLRDGAPQEPAEYRPSLIALRDGTLLTKSAWADLDSFPISTLLPFRSIVVRRSPAESRPPSIYTLRWAGAFYELWQRPATPAVRVIVHDPLGDSNQYEWCGNASSGASRARCSVQSEAVPSCPRIRALGALAARAGGSLAAVQRAPDTVVRASQADVPSGWAVDVAAERVTPSAPGTLRAHVSLTARRRYAVWLGGSFARGFDVSVDGHPLGRVKDQLSMLGQWVQVGDLDLFAGPHEVDVRFPQADLMPGSGDTRNTLLDAIALAPAGGDTGQMLTVAPARAAQLCGRSLDWVEVVVPAAR